MRKRNRLRELSLCLGGIALAGFARHANAQIAVDGSLEPAYGTALTTQTINTSFGDSTAGDGTSGGGSELDAAYGTVQGTTLFVFLSGNFENNGNHVDLFFNDGRSGGQAVLNAVTGTALSGMNGSIFSPGFSATFALDINDFSNVAYTDQFDLVHNTHTYSGSTPLTGGIGNNQNLTGGLRLGLNNTNALGVTGSATGTAATTSDANAVATGLEVGIPLALLGNPSGNIQVLAAINGGGDGYLSNQFLPGLPVGTGSIGAGGPFTGAAAGSFDLSSTTNDWITIANSIPTGTWVAPGSGDWGTGINWVSGSIPNGPGSSASFSTATAAATVTLGQNWTVGSVSFSDSSSYTLAQTPATNGKITLDNGSGTASIADFSGSHTISAPVVLNSNSSFSVVNSGDTMIISGNISGVGSLSVADTGGSGPLVLSGTNTYGGGTIVNSGNLQLASAGALPTGTALTLNASDVPSGVLDLNGNSATVSSITVITGPQTDSTGSTAQIINTSATAGTSTFTYAGSNANPSTFSGYIADNSGSGGGVTALDVTSGSLTLSGNNTYGGGTTVSSGATLVLATRILPASLMGGNTVSLPTGGAITNNGTLEVSSVANAGNISGTGTTIVDATQSLTAVNFSQAGGLVNNGSTSILGTGTVGPVSGTGTLTIGASGALQLAIGSGGSAQSGLVINSGGTLDIANNHLMINYGATTDPSATIYNLLKSGLNSATVTGPAWTGTGITSSVAALPGNKLNYGVGFVDGADNVPGAVVPGTSTPLTSGQLLIAYALYGDVNLDNLVNATDFAVFGVNFNTAQTGWDKGDFLYNGLINASDFALLGTNFGKAASGVALNLPASDYAALDAFAVANGLSLPSVPEPAAISLLAFAGFGAMTGRRRRRKS